MTLSKEKSIVSKVKMKVIVIILCVIFSIIFTMVALFFCIKPKHNNIVAITPNGQAKLLKTLDPKNLTKEEVLIKYYLSRYIEYTEGYDAFLANEFFRFSQYFSNETVKKEILNKYENNKFYKSRRTPGVKMETMINDIELINPDLAEVHFTLVVHDTSKSNMKLQTYNEKYIALIKFTFVNDDNQIVSNEEKLINPVSFKVLSYQVNKEQSDE